MAETMELSEAAHFVALSGVVIALAFLPWAIQCIMAVVVRPRCAHGLNQEIDSVVLDGIQDPGNLGSILRSAAAAGFRQILLSADCTQAWSSKTLRAAMGAHFQLDIHESCDLPAFLTENQLLF